MRIRITSFTMNQNRFENVEMENTKNVIGTIPDNRNKHYSAQII